MNKWTESRSLLGCRVTVHLCGTDEKLARSALERAFSECERIEAAYSRFISGNELAELNAHLEKWTSVSPELFKLIAWGEEVRYKTEGAFDITVKSILEGWGYNAHYSLQETEQGQTGFILLNEAELKVHLTAPIDLGGLGKGYAVDQMMKKLKEFSDVCIDAGGDIFARGQDFNEKTASRKPWRMIFEHPTDLTKGLGYVDVDGFAVAASSPARRKWRNRHHLVDPRSGQPAMNMLAVYTQAENVQTADSYSTALFVLGYEEAQRLLSELPVEAMLVSSKGGIYRSKGFQGRLFL